MSKPPYERILVIDFETRWSRKHYTLTKLTTEQYIRNNEFKAFGCCIKTYDVPGTVWVTHEDLQATFDAIDWSTTAVLAHNAQFDVSILSWVYGCKPAFIFDSLSMARALRGVEAGNSLARLAEEFNLPPKGQAVHSTDGLPELTPEIEAELAEYCAHDTYLCEEVFKRLIPGFPAKELRLIDLTLKMFTNPVLELDKEMLSAAIEEEKTKREDLLGRLGVEESILASNPQFGELLRSLGVEPPTKVSKTTGEKALALAKNDALFQALLNSDNEDVALLCEARLAVKSTLERTRAQRFLDIAQRGLLPVPLNYYGAHTGRWSASKGSGLNLQNLKRGSFLRKSIMAPAGNVLVVCDLSQIEPRVLAWLAGYEELLNIFRSGQDAYAQFGAQMFGIPGLSKESHPDLRQSAKSALLGCFGADTLVLTNRGWVPIIQVQATDMVWDGEEWVCHQGVVPQGEKEVLTALGISATSDHEILTEHGWVEWSEALANLSLLTPATALANSLALAGTAALMDPSGNASLLINPACGVSAVGKVSLSDLIFGADVPQDVTTVPKRKQPLLVWLAQGLRQCALMARTETVCLTKLAPSSSGVRTLKAKATQTTVDEALLSIRLGLSNVLSSCATLLDSLGGTRLSYNSTESTTTKGMRRATYGSSQEAKTCRTNARSKHVMSKHSNSSFEILKQKMQTYDIAYAGPRNSYTILTSEGPLIVHNCGYGLGWASFAAQLLTGFLGAPPTRYDKAFAKQLGVDAEYLSRFVEWEENLKRMEEIPRTCSDAELVVHSVSAKKIIDKYREAATPVKDFWSFCNTAIERALAGGRQIEYKCLTFEKERVVLPSGLALRYPGLKSAPGERGVQWTYGDNRRLYGGKLTENIVQAVARCVMTDGMLRIQNRYPCVLTVHDEVVVAVPESEEADAKTWVLAQMVMEPKYMPGIPLEAEVDSGQRYGDAK